MTEEDKLREVDLAARNLVEVLEQWSAANVNEDDMYWWIHVQSRIDMLMLTLDSDEFFRRLAWTEKLPTR